MKAFLKNFICFLLVIVVIFGSVFVLYHTSWGTDAYKTFYLTDLKNNIYSTVDSVTIPTLTEKQFKVKYSLSKKTGYTAKVYSYVTEETAFAYTVNGESKQYSAKTDLTEQFKLETEEETFTITMPATMESVLSGFHSGAAVKLNTDIDISKTVYFKLVVTSTENEDNEITIRLKASNVTSQNGDVDDSTDGLDDSGEELEEDDLEDVIALDLKFLMAQEDYQKDLSTNDAGNSTIKLTYPCKDRTSGNAHKVILKNNLNDTVTNEGVRLACSYTSQHMGSFIFIPAFNPFYGLQKYSVENISVVVAGEEKGAMYVTSNGYYNVYAVYSGSSELYPETEVTYTLYKA